MTATTGRRTRLRDSPTSIAGNTGTAEKYVMPPTGYLGLKKLFVRLMDEAWWCGYGATDEPTIAMCVVIENGGHGGESQLLRRSKVFEEHFQTPAGEITQVGSD